MSLGKVVCVFGDSGLCLWGQWSVSLGTVVCVFEDSGLSLWGQWSVSLGIASDWGRGWLDMAKVTRVSYFWVVH